MDLLSIQTRFADPFAEITDEELRYLHDLGAPWGLLLETMRARRLVRTRRKFRDAIAQAGTADRRAEIVRELVATVDIHELDVLNRPDLARLYERVVSRLKNGQTDRAAKAAIELLNAVCAGL